MYAFCKCAADNNSFNLVIKAKTLGPGVARRLGALDEKMMLQCSWMDKSRIDSEAPPNLPDSCLHNFGEKQHESTHTVHACCVRVVAEMIGA